MGGWVYILASQRNGTLYIGVTNDLARRVYEHKETLVPGFTRKYGVDKLVHYEFHERIEDAIVQEKRLKNWKRAWKIALIEKTNRLWRDLYEDLNT
ncbi:MAG TPA: GIY-YIG nuclease family protein [Parvularculaceae bacterium]|nr:GIY-YIG nuclease family protein [Parvularculaceae bacterium]